MRRLALLRKPLQGKNYDFTNFMFINYVFLFVKSCVLADQRL